MSAFDIDFDENRGGSRHPENKLSVPLSGDMFKATKHVMAWDENPSGGNGRATVPSVFVENWFAVAPIPNPEALHLYTLPTRCLDIPYYVAALAQLAEEGLFRDKNNAIIEYKLYDELVRAAWAIILSLPDEDAFKIDANAFEWLEGFPASGARNAKEDEIAWFSTIPMSELAKRQSNYYVIASLRMLVGHHGTAASRIEKTGTYYVMVGGIWTSRPVRPPVLA